MPSSAPLGPRVDGEIEQRIARLLLVGAVLGISLVAVGVVLMAVNGVDPLSASFPPFEAWRVVPDMLALRPDGFLWAGIVILIATPIARVVGEIVTFALRGDRIMSGVGIAVLAVIALSVIAALLIKG